MKIGYWVLCFIGGAALANFIPHMISGTTGAPFPTPFADPPGQGLSSPTVNVAWAMTNLALAIALLAWGRFSFASRASIAAAFLGMAAMGLMLSQVFASLPR